MLFSSNNIFSCVFLSSIWILVRPFESIDFFAKFRDFCEEMIISCHISLLPISGDNRIPSVSLEYSSQDFSSTDIKPDQADHRIHAARRRNRSRRDLTKFKHYNFNQHVFPRRAWIIRYGMMEYFGPAGDGPNWNASQPELIINPELYCPATVLIWDQSVSIKLRHRHSCKQIRII